MLSFDTSAVKSLTTGQKHRLLLTGRWVFVFFSLVIFLLGILIILQGEAVWGMWLVVFALFVMVVSCSRILFYTSNKKNEFIITELVRRAIATEERRTGKVLSEVERDKIRFKYDPRFQAQIIKRYQKNITTRHQQEINRLTANVKQLEAARAAEITRLSELRWQHLGLPKFLTYNLAEGKIKLNDEVIYDFCELEKAEINIDAGKRYVKRPSRKIIGKKLHAKAERAHEQLSERITAKDEVETILPETPPAPKLPSVLVTRVIDTCERISVTVFLTHNAVEIVLSDKNLDQSSKKFKHLQKQARGLQHTLQILARTPMPTEVAPVESEHSVIAIDQRLEEARQALANAKSTSPKFRVPERYLEESESEFQETHRPQGVQESRTMPKLLENNTAESDLLKIESEEESGAELPEDTKREKEKPEKAPKPPRSTPKKECPRDTLNIEALAENLAKDCAKTSKDVK